MPRAWLQSVRIRRSTKARSLNWKPISTGLKQTFPALSAFFFSCCCSSDVVFFVEREGFLVLVCVLRACVLTAYLVFSVFLESRGYLVFGRGYTGCGVQPWSWCKRGRM